MLLISNVLLVERNVFFTYYAAKEAVNAKAGIFVLAYYLLMGSTLNQRYGGNKVYGLVSVAKFGKRAER